MFRFILNYLRDGSLNFSEELYPDLLTEATFYQIRGMITFIESRRKKASESKSTELSTEKQYRLVQDVNSRDLADIFNENTIQKGYDFEDWCAMDNGKLQLLFAKKLSKGELAFIEKLIKVQ